MGSSTVPSVVLKPREPVACTPSSCRRGLRVGKRLSAVGWRADHRVIATECMREGIHNLLERLALVEHAVDGLVFGQLALLLK